MNFNIFSKTIEIPNCKPIIIETGKLARQAHGAVTVTCGKTVLLATVVSNLEAKPDQSFFPLTVDYQEKFSAAGRIPGGFLRREGRLTDFEILISRIIDRCIRPLFPDGYLNETQVLVSVISLDTEVPGDALAGLAASAAICISDIPFDGPISEVRVAKVDGQLIANPSPAEIEKSTLEIIVGGSSRDVNMVEGESKECSEDELIEAIKFGHNIIKTHCAVQEALAKECGKPKREIVAGEEDLELYEKVKAACQAKILEVSSAALPKSERSLKFKAIKKEFLESITEEELETFNTKLFETYYYKVEKETVRNMVLDSRKRLDGRNTDEIRPLYMEIDNLPSPHGSALFTRGETQSLTTVTLGTKDDEQLVDKPEGLSKSKFMLHYNFPPFCTGEAKFMRGVSRREVGHGNLAMRSIKQMLPEGLDNPYTIRVVSDVLESNGSSSMATVCASSLALMDSGIPFKKHVSGIAMGMIADDKGRYAVLSDILGDEDHLGDMDFKVTGTKDGICGCQMDIKVDGMSYEVLAEALTQAKKGRLHILEHMEKTIAEPRPEVKPHTPRVISFEIPGDTIGAVIGTGGKIIQELQSSTGTVITIEEFKDRKPTIGKVSIYGPNVEAIKAAESKVKGIIAVPEPGEVYEAVVKSIMDYGGFVEFLPGKQGLLHISEISWNRINSMEGIYNEGDVIKVKLTEIDKQGRYKLSAKALLPKENN
jgi:polyribonucleotide nucleotidyltransferase